MEGDQLGPLVGAVGQRRLVNAMHPALGDDGACAEGVRRSFQALVVGYWTHDEGCAGGSTASVRHQQVNRRRWINSWGRW